MIHDRLIQKEVKAKRINQFIKEKKMPVVTLRLNIPGIDKKPEWSGILFKEGVKLLENQLDQLEFEYENLDDLLGFEYYEHLRIFAVKGSAEQIKKHMMEIENEETIGRLVDIDVVDIDSKGLSRSDYDLGQRKCFLCDEPAFVCSRAQRHSQEALLTFMILKAQVLLDK